MNAQGISVFYGATCPDIVLAEVRPPVGSFVDFTCFKIIRPLRFLDLTAFGDVHQFGSILTLIIPLFSSGWVSSKRFASA